MIVITRLRRAWKIWRLDLVKRVEMCL